MIYGKISSSFELLTEETAIKWRMPVPAAVATNFTAGGVVNLSSSTGLPIAPVYANTIMRAASASCFLTGVLFDNYTSTIDDSQGSGYITAVLGRHVGRSSFIAADVTASVKAGTPLYAETTGKFLVTSPGTAAPVAYLLSCDGTYATYYWAAD